MSFLFVYFQEDDLTPLSEPVVSPTRRRISDGIMNIMSKLHLSRDCPIDNEVSAVK